MKHNVEKRIKPLNDFFTSIINSIIESNDKYSLAKVELVRSFINKFLGFYELTDKPMNKKEISIVIPFFINTIFENELGKLQIEANKTSKEYLALAKLVKLCINKENWKGNEFAYLEIESVFLEILFLFMNEEVIKSIQLSNDEYEKINKRLFEKWATIKVHRLTNTLRKRYVNPEILDSGFVFNTFYHSLYIPKRVSSKKEILTWSEIESEMKEIMQLWEKLFNRNNFKHSPNRKYPDELFDFIDEERNKGFTKYTAIDRALQRKYEGYSDFDVVNDSDSVSRLYSYRKKGK